MPHNNVDQPEARVLEEEPGYGDTQRLLNSNRSGVRALEVSHRRHEYHYELPPLAARLPAAAALLAVCTCTALLVFGPSDGFFSRDAHVQRLPPACQSAVAGFFWDALVPRHYNFSLRLRPHHFQWQPTTTATPGSDEPQLDSFDASVTIVFEVLQPTSCILLHASGMQFLHASLAVPLDSASPQQAQHGSDSSAAPFANSTLPAATSLCSSAEDCEEVVVPVPSVVRGPQSSLDQDLVAVDVGGIELQPGSRAVLQLRYRGSLAADRLGLHQSDPFVLCNGSSWSTAAAGEGNNTPGGGSSSGGGGNANNTVTSRGSLDVSNSSSCSAAVLVATQLEPLGARKLMPCYDGPRFKASFQVMLEVPSGLTALSNMPVLRRAPAPAADTAGTAAGARAGAAGGEDKPPVVPMDRVLFEPTPIMSPYLLAIAAGELRQLEGASEHGPQQPEVRMWAVPGMEPQLQVAQTAALGALAFFRDWTGIEQPVPKFDFVAIPGKGGAMENWGLLLFDEARFLVNKGTEGAYGAWLAADVVCHETAHQWFGNLVTAHDWTQLTVNEGVASFMEYKCIEAAFPYMPARPLFFRATSPSLERLGIHEGPLERARQYLGDPLLGPLVPPSDLQSVDSVVMYSKGAALLGMVEAFLEERRPGAFQAGFQAFLRQHLGGTAIMADLLAAIGQEATAATGPSNSSRGDGEPSPAPAPVYDPGAAAELVVFAQLAQQYADQHGSHMASNSTGSGSSTGDATSAVNALGAWLHALGFPYLTFMDAPGVENGSADPQAMVAAAEQHPYCSWHQLPPQLEAGLGASNLNTSAARGQVLSCPGEGGVQWWLPLSAPSASGLLAAANASDTSSGGGSGDSSDAGMEPNAGVPLWVADPWGAGLYRTAYPERYLHTLLAAIKGFKPCYRRTSDRNSTGDSSSSAGAGSNKSSSSADTCSASWTGGRGRALNFSVGSRSCGDLDAGSCELSAGPLLAAAPVLADVAALAAVGIYPASWALEAAQAAAHAEIAATGVGSYLLLLPAAEALDAMRPLAAGNSSTCLQQLDLLTAELLAPQAARILNLTQAGVPSLFLGASPNSSERQQQRSQQDAFLGQLASSPLLWRAALVGSNAAAGALCSALPATPLWGHVWEAAAVAGKGGIPEGPECPYNFEATGALPDNGSTGSGRGAPGVPRSCRWAASAAEQGVPAVLRRGPDGVPPPDLLPPIYAVAAAWAPGCAQQLQALEATPGAVIEGLMHCWEQEEDGAEAERCLHALPFATTKDGALEQALDLLLDPAASSCTDASAAASSSSTGGSVPHASLLAAEVRAANRRRALRGKLANLLKNAASRSRDAWLLVLHAVQRRLTDSRTARSGLLGALCSTLEQLPAPWLAEDFAALQTLVAGVQGRGSEGMQCSAAALKRVLGRAVQAQQVAASSGAELCQSLARMLPYN